MHIEKEKIKLFTDGMTIYLCRKSKRMNKTLKLTSNYSKVTGHKVHVHKLTFFLYASNEGNTVKFKI